MAFEKLQNYPSASAPTLELLNNKEKPKTRSLKQKFS